MAGGLAHALGQSLRPAQPDQRLPWLAPGHAPHHARRRQASIASTALASELPQSLLDIAGLHHLLELDAAADRVGGLVSRQQVLQLPNREIHVLGPGADLALEALPDRPSDAEPEVRAPRHGPLLGHAGENRPA